MSDEDGEEFTKSIGVIFASTSAKNDSGITSLFKNIAKKLLELDFNFSANSNTEVKLNTAQKKKKKLC